MQALRSRARLLLRRRHDRCACSVAGDVLDQPLPAYDPSRSALRAYVADASETKHQLDSRLRVFHAVSPFTSSLQTAHKLTRRGSVDYAGEVAAVRIYEGQADALQGDQASVDLVSEMGSHERRHRDAFQRILPHYRVRPSALTPVWSAAGYALGYLSASLGAQSAMAATVAVEDAITAHYNEQLRFLINESSRGRDDSYLRSVIVQCRDDEEHHQQVSLQHGAEQVHCYPDRGFVLR